MTRRALLSFALALSLAGATSARPPNVILILADDLGLNPVGAYGNPYAHTPVIDQLAREGVRYDTAYAASPVCSPSRAAIITGKSPARLHLTDFISGTPFPYARLSQPKWRRSLPLKEETLPEMLLTRGYATALFGKWHLAKGYLPPHSLAQGPDKQGFQEHFITHKPSEDDDPEADSHGVKAIRDRALDFITRHHDQPFFLFLCPNTIHNPLMAPAELVAKHAARPGANEPHNHPTIAAMMEQLDEAIGDVLKKIDEHGLTRDTIVIFTSDNGGGLKDASQAPLRGGKAQLYEGGLRIPLIVRWPEQTPAGTVSAFPSTSADLFTTILEVTGVTASPVHSLDGVSLLPSLRGEPALETRPLFWHYPHYHGAGIHGPASSVRIGDWKYIRYYESALTDGGAPAELFNLRLDPGETTNLADSEPARVRELDETLSNWLAATGAQFPTVNPNYDSARGRETGY